MVFLGTIHSSINCSDMSISGRKETIWKRIRTPFFYHEKRICRQTFLFLHRIRQRTFSIFLSVRMHGNKKRLPSSTTSHETIKEVVKFIINVAEDQALLLPGLVPHSVICGNSFALLWLLCVQPQISVGLAERTTTVFTSPRTYQTHINLKW